MKRIITLILITSVLHAGCNVNSGSRNTASIQKTRNCILNEANQLKAHEIKALKEINKSLKKLAKGLI